MSTPAPPTSLSGNPDPDAATAGLVLGLAVGSVTCAVCLILFELLRRVVPTVYEYRLALKEQADEDSLGYYNEPIGTCPRPGRAPLFGWISSTLSATPETLEKTYDLDAAFFVRFLRTRIILFAILSVLSCVFLLPAYWTGPHKDLDIGNDLRTRGIQRFTMGNVSTDDPWRFWYAWVLYVVSATVTTLMMVLDYRAYSVARKRYRSGKSPANFACLVQDIPSELATEEGIVTYWNGLFPKEVEFVHQARNVQKVIGSKAKWLKAITRRERAELCFEISGERPEHKVGGCLTWKESHLVDSIDFWRAREEHYEKKIKQYYAWQGSLQGLPAFRSAIVVFKTKKSAAIASQTLFSQNPTQWRTSRAPEPKAVNWNALGVSGSEADVRFLVAGAAITGLTLFWIVPVAFVQGLANLSALSQIKIAGKKPFMFLEVVRTWGNGLVGVIEGLLPPIIHAIFLSLIPIIIRLLCNICGVPSLGRLEALVRDWFFFFLFFNGFLFVLITGSALQAAPELIKLVQAADIRKFANVLAKAVPSQGTFFMTYIVLQALSATPQLLVQIPRVAVRWFMRKFLSKTPRELKSRDGFGGMFLYFRYYALAQLVTVIGLVYCVVSPFVVPCCLVYFVTNYLVHTYNIAFSMVQPFSDAGSMFSGSISATFMGLLFQGLILGGIFALKGQGTQSSLSFGGAAITTALYFYIRKRFRCTATHGSLVQTLLADDEETGYAKIRPDIARSYMHPGLLPLSTPVVACAVSKEGETSKPSVVPSRRRLENEVQTTLEASSVEKASKTLPCADFDSSDGEHGEFVDCRSSLEG